MKIISVVGARPNFMKIAPFIREIEKHNSNIKNEPENKKVKHLLVHTGQHYDDRMNNAFFNNLQIPNPDINLGIGSGSHAEQVGKTMIAFEKVIKTEKPDWVVVVGDVNATLACSITAKKEKIKLCHIEAGLRSKDMAMPEEINRLVTDRLSDLLLTPDMLSVENLKSEGIPSYKIRFVGNIMIDTLESNINKARNINIQKILEENSLIPEILEKNLKSNLTNYTVLTLHRPSNVDHKEILEPIVQFLINNVASRMSIMWPLHPRTLKQLNRFNLFNTIKNTKNLILMNPLNYHDMLRLNIGAHVMLTDSGGLQEECSIVGTPCLTLRWNTERPVTLRKNGGVNVLVGNKIDKIETEFEKALKYKKKSIRPELWDGKTAQRCLSEILEY